MLGAGYLGTGIFGRPNQERKSRRIAHPRCVLAFWMDRCWLAIGPDLGGKKIMSAHTGHYFL